ncbi:MAG: DUF2249 domain-containing protein [Bacteroidota bacterium]|nr:DUF2249 domain-containing protein [Bacteroidota bacterium]
MITINANTKIATILKASPDALDAIISISSKFEKLRNPLLRKLMAGRTSLAMASGIGGCDVNDFFIKLKPLGFLVDEDIEVDEGEVANLPAFLQDLQPEQLFELDVRPILDNGKDPLNDILQQVKALQEGQTLKIINSFEPKPLMLLLGRQGFQSFTLHEATGVVATYFYKNTNAILAGSTAAFPQPCNSWDDCLKKFEHKMQVIDVRNLEMPTPMLAILNALDNLQPGNALFVQHKRIPVFLLPELGERKFEYRVKQITDGDVQLLIFKD